MAGFVQVVEFKTTRIDEVTALGEKFRSEREAAGDQPVLGRATFTSDRDRPGYYLSIIEFESYESAMENSNRPETTEFATQMAALCDGPPKFYNLDIMRSWES